MDDFSFPNEDEVKADFEKEIGEKLLVNRRLFSACLNSQVDTHFTESSLPDGVLHCLQISLCRTLRLHRTVIELCERGEAAIAASVARSMFENAIAVQFVLREQFSGEDFENCKSPAGCIKKLIEGSEQVQRAEMFLLYSGLRQHEFIRKNETDGAVTADLIRLKECIDKEMPLDELNDVWGEDEIKKMMQANTCSGLNIADLCLLLGREWYLWRLTIYGDLSAHTHCADAPHYTDESEDGSQISCKWHGKPAVANQILMVAETLCTITIGSIHRAVDYDETFEWPANADSTTLKFRLKEH